MGRKKAMQHGVCVFQQSGINWCWGPDPCRRSQLTGCHLEEPSATAHPYWLLTLWVLCSCWIQHRLWKDPPPPCPLFSVQMKYWWEALAPFFFIYSFTHSLSLSVSLSPWVFWLDSLGPSILFIITFSVLVILVQSSGRWWGKRQVHCLICVCGFVC